MKLFQIINFIKNNQDTGNTILLELILPYRKLLKVYFEDYFCDEPIVMVTDVMNAAQYGLIVPSGEFCEVVQKFAEKRSCNNDSDQDVINDIETIYFKSTAL